MSDTSHFNGSHSSTTALPPSPTSSPPPSPTSSPTSSPTPKNVKAENGLDVAESFVACEQTVLREAKNFYYGMRLTPEDRRKYLYAVYAWMRYADDVMDGDVELGQEVSHGEGHQISVHLDEQIDAHMDARRARLGEMKQAMEHLSHEIASGGDGEARFASKLDSQQSLQSIKTLPCWPAVRETLVAYPELVEIMLEMMQGLDEDAAHQGYETWEALDRYCHRVGGTVGQACSRVWGFTGDPQEVMTLASLRGRAFQVVNILRDIGVDARGFAAVDSGPVGISTRCYLPSDLTGMPWQKTMEFMLRWGRRDEAHCEQIIMEMAKRARGMFAASAGLDAMVAADCRSALRTLTGVYLGVLEVIEKQPRVCVNGRARVATPKKILIMAESTLRGWLEEQRGGGVL